MFRITVGQKALKEKWRWITHAISAYANIITTFQVGIRADGVGKEQEPDVEEFLQEM